MTICGVGVGVGAGDGVRVGDGLGVGAGIGGVPVGVAEGPGSTVGDTVAVAPRPGVAVEVTNDWVGDDVGAGFDHAASETTTTHTKIPTPHRCNIRRSYFKSGQSRGVLTPADGRLVEPPYELPQTGVIGTANAKR